MKTFEERFSKDINKVVSWHKDEKGRRKFLAMFWLTYLAIFLLLVLASYLFTGAGLFFDDSAVGPPWAINWDSAKSVLPFSFGIVIFVIAIALALFFAFFYPGLYKESQSIYFTTKDYRQRKLWCKRMNLTKFNKKQIKWMYKLKYIDKTQYKQVLEAKKKLEKQQKKETSK